MPFWAAICSLCFIGEKIGKFTVIAMLISFIGVLIISCSPYILDEDLEVDVEKQETFGMKSIGIANLVGCSLILVNALC